MTNFQNEKPSKEVEVSKMRSKPHPGSHSPTKAKPDRPDKPAKPVYHVKQVNAHKVVAKAGKEHNSAKVSEGNERKDSHKAEKKKKYRLIKKVNEKEKYKNHSEEMKDEHHKKKKKYKKQGKHGDKEERKKDRKFARITKEKALKTKKPSPWKGIKQINKHVVKAHATHQKTNYHPTVQQHSITRFNNTLGITNKSKPNIKFAHTFGKLNHQDLSYKPNGNMKTVKLETDNSITEELKHLIFKHRKGKLRARLKLHHRKTHNRLSVKGNEHRKSRKVINKTPERIDFPGSEIQHNVLLRKHKTQNGRENGVDHRNKSRLRNETEKLIQSAGAQSNLRPHSSSIKIGMEQETIHEVRTKNGEKNNPSLPGKENKEAIDEVKFNGLRQIVQEKTLARKNTSQKFNPPEDSQTVVDNYAHSSSPIKNLINVADVGQSEKLRESTNKVTLKNASSLGPTKPFQYIISKENQSSNINAKQNNSSTELLEGSSLDDIRFSELENGSDEGSASEEALINDSNLSKAGSTEPSHKIISKEKLSSHINGKQNNTSIELVEGSSFDNFRFSERDSAEDNALGEALSDASSGVISKVGYDARIHHTVTDVGPTGKPQQRRNNTSLEISSKEGSTEPFHKIISKENMPSDINGKQNNSSTELVEGSSFDNFRFSELGSGSSGGSTLEDALSDASSGAISKLDDEVRINHVVIGSAFKATGSTSGLVPSSSLRSDYGESAMGEDAIIERTGNDRDASGVGNNGGFDTEELSTGSADSFLASSSGDINLRNASIRKDVTEKMNRKARTDRLITGSGPEFKDFSAESGNGFNEPSSIAGNYRVSNNGQYATKHKGHYSRIDTDQIISNSGLNGVREFFTSASGPHVFSSLSHKDHQRSDVQVLNENEFETDGSSIESTRGLHENDDSITTSGLFSENILEEEEKENAINHFEEYKETNEPSSEDYSTNDSTDNGIYLPFSADTISGLSAGVSTSGSNPDNVSRSSGSGLNFGGEGDNDEETKTKSNKLLSSGIDNVYSEIFPTATKSIFYLKDTKQRDPLKHFYQIIKNVNEDSPTDISQLDDTDWHDASDNDSGFESGYYESSIQRGSGEYGSSESTAS